MRKMPLSRRSTLSRVSMKLTLAVSGAVALLLILMHVVLAPLPYWAGVGFVIVTGACTYATADWLLTPRLEMAHTLLKQIRKHQFENLETARIPKGDELNALIWEVYRTGLALEKEIRELKRIESYRREFIGNVSHELKTPIFAIHGFAETLLDGALHDDRFNRSFVEKILRNSARLGNLANDLSEISRIETGALKMTAEPFNLRQLVHEVVESLEPKAQSKDITLEYQLPDGLPAVLGHHERIRQVLINLVDNAIKYNNPGGRVEVVARLLPSDELEISVVDDGIGIAPQHISRLTERFYRVDKSRSRSQGGTGLGLAIVKHILGAHDRELMVESHPEQGSTFGFSLPTDTSTGRVQEREAVSTS